MTNNASIVIELDDRVIGLLQTKADINGR